MRTPTQWRVLALIALLYASGATAAPPDALERARTLKEAGRSDEAGRVLREHLAANPNDTAVALLLAEISAATASPGEAIRELTGLAARFPDRPEPLLLLSKVLARVERYEEAASALRQATLRFEAGEGLTAQMFMDLANLYQRAYDPREEAAALDRYLDLAPNDLEALERLIDLRARLGHFEDAMYAQRRLIRARPRDPVAYRYLGELYLYVGRPLSAIDAYKEALKHAPEDVPTLKRLAELYGHQGMVRRRIETLQQVVRRAPNDAAAHIALAEALADIGEGRRAAIVMTRAIPMRPYDLQLRIRAAELHEAADEYEEAIDLLQGVLHVDPGNLSAKASLARLHESRGEPIIALGYYRELRQYDETDPAIAERIGELEIAVRPRIGAGYRFFNNRTDHTGHEGRVWYENQPSDLLRYFVGYKSSFNYGDSLLTNEERDLQAHGGWLGVALRVAPRTIIDAEVNVNGYIGGHTFVGTRVGLTQRAVFPMEFRLWFERREDSTTIDALAQETVVYDLHAQLDIEPINRWLVEVGASYGRWIHTDEPTGERRRNNGATWFAGTGVRAVEDPVLLELLVDYTGMAFERDGDVAGSRIPYFSPDLYQTIGLRAYYEHRPHWRVRYAVYARPHWIFEDEAVQLGYGAELEVKFHKRHWMQLSYNRTDTLYGTTDAIFRENVVQVVYIGVF